MKGLVPGGKEKDKARQSVFLTPTNPCGNDPEEERNLMTISQFHRKQLMLRNGSMIRMQFSGYDCQKRRIKDWNSGKRSHLQSRTYATIPGNCIDRVTSQNGERVDFERLETPRPAPKVTLKKNWQSQQQQQHSSSCTDVLSLVKTKVVKEHWTGVSDGLKRFTEVTTSTWQLGHDLTD